MASRGAAHRAGVPVSSARAEASRKNGAKSRGPKTEEGERRSSRNASKQGLRAQTLPDAAEFAELEAALIAEPAPVGARGADRIEAVLFEGVASRMAGQAHAGHASRGPGVQAGIARRRGAQRFDPSRIVRILGRVAGRRQGADHRIRETSG